MKKNSVTVIIFPIDVFFPKIYKPVNLYGSKERKLQKEDYKLITHDDRISIRSAINFSYQLKGFNALSNNFNKRLSINFPAVLHQ